MGRINYYAVAPESAQAALADLSHRRQKHAAVYINDAGRSPLEFLNPKP